MPAIQAGRKRLFQSRLRRLSTTGVVRMLTEATQQKRARLKKREPTMAVLDKFRLDGKRALITGGSRGLGLEISRALGEAGAKLVLVGRDEANLEEARKSLVFEVPEVRTIVSDIGHPGAAVKMCGRALNECAPIDILANNVGGRRVHFPTGY